ncbi:MAG TPA: hypothetical protein VGM56_09205 [Byssovorax sp.]|jgi:hypothetical protein|nr:hypothetical protein [Polyangia bacterium]
MSLKDDLATRLEGDATLPLVTLDSGAVVGVDAKGRFTFTSDAGVRSAFDATSAVAFGEVVEQGRDAFEERLAAGARAAELPADEIVAAFPAVELVRALLAKEFAYLTRLSLLWILPSELRELRADIVRISESDRTPGPIKDLAKRLIVPAGYG